MLFMRELEFLIDDKNDGKRIRDFLREFGVSSSLLTRLKKNENGITLNGEFAKAIEFLHSGDILKIRIEENGKAPQKNPKLKLEIIYEDEDILIVNKPAFMPVHESRNHRGDTLANAVACILDEGNAFRAVFRLDRDTSGLVLIAKNELAAAKLAGKIEKDYYAICDGALTHDGTVDAPIKRVGDSIIKRCVSPDGERAVTHYSIIKKYEDRTLVKLKLETGRTHQIRVHFSHIGHPLTGDTLYGNASPLIDRQALHCKTLYFTHPITNKKIAVSCDFPDDFGGLL